MAYRPMTVIEARRAAERHEERGEMLIADGDASEGQGHLIAAARYRRAIYDRPDHFVLVTDPLADAREA